MRRLRARWLVPVLIGVSSAAALTAWAQVKPPPDEANVRYGPYDRNVLDLWKANSDRPTPLVIFIHGGGFRGGDKSNLSPELLGQCLASGISVAAINYRLSSQAPYPAPMHDGARAVQFLRSRADRWNLDPGRFAATGNSAGAGISLWVGFHDDLAEPSSEDPVARQSSRLSCLAVIGAQSTYDPRVIKTLIGGRAHEHSALKPFYGLTDEEWDSDRAHRLFEEASPINHVSAGDPPVFLFYSESKGELPADAPPGRGIHHPLFGTYLKQKLDPLGIECVLRHRDDYAGRGDADAPMDRDLVDFLIEQFRRPTGR
jgi:acetyl esterase